MGDVPEQVFIDAARARVLADIGGSDLTIGPWDPEWVAQMIQAEAERPENRAAVALAYRAGQAGTPGRWALPDGLRGDGPCGDCGTLNNIIWFTESVFWNAVMRPLGYESEPLLCIPCFVVRADAAGYFPTGWRLLPDWHWETKAERERRRAVGPRMLLADGLTYPKEFLTDATPAADGQDGDGRG